MTTEQTAQQLELAAQILRTGHPWECKFSANAFEKPVVSLITAICDEKEIRPILATPPDNRPLHNPDNLTAEQVGVGWRLVLPEEMDGRFQNGLDKCEWWSRGQGWRSTNQVFAHKCLTDTLRVPLQTPWPEPADPYAELKAAHAAGKVIEVFVKDDEYGPDRWSKKESDGWPLPPERYRIKPTESAKPEPAFQLPPPPPGMRWHREDGWKPDDLPSGYRPLVDGEKWVAGDEILRFAPSGWQIGGTPGDILDEPTHGGTSRCRTTRPLVFNHAGKTWTWHRPGDPMPCDGERIVAWLMRDEDRGYLTGPAAEAGCKDIPPTSLNWEADTTIIGWRYADEKKTVPLGPEDVPPGSAVTTGKIEGAWAYVVAVDRESVLIPSRTTGKLKRVTYEELRESRKVNRSIPLTGKWDPDAWEPCSKTIPA